MSVTFSLGREDERSLNLAQLNAIDLLRWLGIPVRDETDLYGSMPASELAARCRRRLWDEPRNYDPELPGSTTQVPGGPVVVSIGRRAGYLREKTEALLALVDGAAADAVVRWY